MKKFKIIAFTHKSLDLQDIGKLHVEEADWEDRLIPVKKAVKVDELLYISTCNRVEFILATEQEITNSFLEKFFNSFQTGWDKKQIRWAVEHCRVFKGRDALEHFFYVASSIDSLVVGEREIITQVRTAFEKCHAIGLTGDFINLLVRRTIETAKNIYTTTQIAQNPISVVSLAYRKLRQLDIRNDARFLIVGAGQTNTSMAQYLKKHKYANFMVFNRSLENAERLAKELDGKAKPLSELPFYKAGFDVLITCTGASEPIITEEIYTQLIKGNNNKKVVVDLAIPSDVAPEVLDKHEIRYIGIESLKSIARENLQKRQKELERCKVIVDEKIEEFRKALKERQVEIAMREVPEKIKEIHQRALTQVFEKDINQMDEKSKKVLEEVMAYMKKKYISVPMKMARKIMTNE